MPLLRINAAGDRPVLADAPRADLAAGLDAALAPVPVTAPVMVLIHGFRFSPWVPDHDPHGHILSMTPRPGCWKAVSWPRKLGFADAPGTGLALALGWEARAGGLRGTYTQAAKAGVALARLLDMLHALAPDRRVDLMAHSLGARVVMSALPHLVHARPDRALLLAPAEYRSRALAALDSPAGRTLSVIQIAPGENRAFDLGFQTLIPAPARADRALGVAPPRCANWLVVDPARADHAAHLAAQGVRIRAADRPVCHWSSYRRPGLFPLYRAVIRDRADWPLSRLRTPAVQQVSASPPLPPGLPTA